MNFLITGQLDSRLINLRAQIPEELFKTLSQKGRKDYYQI